MYKRTSTLLLLALLTVTSQTSWAEDKVSISDLAWMTGHWSGAVGNGTLEENWIKPVDGSIASLVRMTGQGKTSMVEMIVIGEENNTLMLRIQQWDPGFSPRTPEPQTMKLVELGKNKVKFEATGPGGMKSLGYSRPMDDAFDINVETEQGAFTINLKSK